MVRGGQAGTDLYTYAQAETALASMYGIPAEKQTGAFRGRIKQFRKLGFPLGLRPGTGNKTLYSLEQVAEWAICLEFARFGMTPQLIAETLKSQFFVLQDVFATALVFNEDFLTARDFNKDWLLVFYPETVEPREGIIFDVRSVKEMHESLDGLLDHGRFGLINLTRLLWRLQDRLEPEPSREPLDDATTRKAAEIFAAFNRLHGTNK
jgi:hypothetical protein